MLPGTSPGKHNKSFPAINDLAEISPFGKYLATPCISKASVKMRPLYPNSVFSKPFTVLADKLVGRFVVVSIAGTDKCATIILPTPALIISLNGYNSKSSNCGLVL